MAIDGVRIPLVGARGVVVAYTFVDPEDAAFARTHIWRMNTHGYAQRYTSEDGRRRYHLLHREILGLAFGDPREGDHIDRDRLNNRRANLRSVPAEGNRQNRPSYAGSSSRFRGVSWDKDRGKWRARIRGAGRRDLHLGLFDSEEQAGEAARQARQQFMPYAVN